jgi:hypothetical protein
MANGQTVERRPPLNPLSPVFNWSESDNDRQIKADTQPKHPDYLQPCRKVIDMEHVRD